MPTKDSPSIKIKDALYYFKEGKYKPVILIINGLCSYEETEPSKDPEKDLKEAIYLQKVLEIRESPEIRERFFKILNSVRNVLQK